MPRRFAPEARLVYYIDKSGGEDACWPWTGPTRQGYGVIEYRDNGAKRMLMAHRLAYEVMVGPIPEGHNVLHRCDNPPCCNPLHLFTGTQEANMHDMWAKGRQQTYTRQARGERVAKAKMTAEQVTEMRRRFNRGETTVELGQAYGISQVAAWNICHRQTWKHVS